MKWMNVICVENYVRVQKNIRGYIFNNSKLYKYFKYCDGM